MIPGVDDPTKKPPPTPLAGVGGNQQWVQLPGGGKVPASHPMAQKAGATPLQPGQPQNLQQSVTQRLISQINQDPNSINFDDPGLRSQQNAFNLEQQRGLEFSRAALAQRRAAQGLGTSGAADADLERLLTGAGEARSGFAGQLAARELAARRQQIMQALQLGAGMITAQQQRELQRELASIDDATRRLGIDVQRTLGLGQLALGAGQLGLGYANLNANQQQFYDQLGFNIGAFQSGLNNPFQYF